MAGSRRAPAGTERPRAVVLIDGEHYPSVVADALRELASLYDIRAAAFMGGVEKLRERGDEGVYGVPVVSGPDPVGTMCTAIDRFRPEVVVDASDEPVLTYWDRFRLISHALARSVRYDGPDFHFSPPQLERLASSPSLSIIGTGKRVGKTAISGYVARLLRTARGSGPGAGIVIVPMGRGGPSRPEVVDGVESKIGVLELLGWSRAGRHASSDHFEDAVLSRVATVGCRRCGGGMAGGTLTSNVAEGALVANDLRPAFTVFEGSGAAIPPVATDARLLVAGAGQEPEYLSGYLGTYRLLISDAVILTMAEPPMAGEERLQQMLDIIHEERPELPVIPVVFRPRPMERVLGRRVALFCTAPAALRATLMEHLARVHGCEVVLFSNALADRAALAVDVEQLGSAGVEVVLTEIKAAAIDVVAEAADRLGLPVVFVDNVPMEVAPARSGDLDALCLRVVGMAERRFAASVSASAPGSPLRGAGDPERAAGTE